jgi:hypothetical protein
MRNTMPAGPSELLLELSDSRWMQFISRHPDAVLFHHPAWLRLLQTCYGYRAFIAAVAAGSGEILAGVPIMSVSSPLTGRRWVALPFTDYCMPLACNEQALPALTGWLARLYAEGRIRCIEVRWALPDHPALRTSEDYVLQTIGLGPDAGEVEKGLSRTTRQNIRAAGERGVRVEMGSDLEHIRLFYRLQLETRRKHGVPAQPWRFFRLLEQIIFRQGFGFTLLAYHGAVCIAGMVLLHWNRSLIAKYAASRAETLDLRPNNLLFWKAIEWGCQQGVRTFDMGRTEIANEGLRRYKQGWGSEETPITYSTFSARPDRKSPRRLDCWMGTFIQKSPLWVCRLTGELLYRHFG